MLEEQVALVGVGDSLIEERREGMLAVCTLAHPDVER